MLMYQIFPKTAFIVLQYLFLIKKNIFLNSIFDRILYIWFRLLAEKMP